jgi:hypothetical protein
MIKYEGGLIPEINYGDWYSKRAGIEEDPKTGTFPAAVTVLLKYGNLKKYPGLYDFLNGKDGIGDKVKKPTMSSMMKRIYTVADSIYLNKTLEEYFPGYSNLKSIEDRSSYGDEKQKNTIADKGNPKKYKWNKDTKKYDATGNIITPPKAGSKDSQDFKAIRGATKDTKLTKKHTASGEIGGNYPELEGDDKKFLEIFLMIQTWGGGTGKGPITSYTDQSKADSWTEEDGYDRVINQAHRWIPFYIEGVNQIKNNKSNEGIKTFVEKIPQLGVSFATKHAQIWGEYFNSKGSKIDVVPIFDTRISTMILGVNPNSNGATEKMAKIYSYIASNVDSAKGLAFSKIEKALFGFSNTFYNNDTTQFIFKEDSSVSEEDINEAKLIFCERNPNKCDGENNILSRGEGENSAEKNSSKSKSSKKKGLSSNQVIFSRKGERISIIDLTNLEKILKSNPTDDDVLNGIDLYDKIKDLGPDEVGTGSKKDKVDFIKDFYKQRQLAESLNKWAKWATQ